MQIQSICEIIGKYGCLAFSYLWVAGIPEMSLVTDFEKLVGIGALDDECTVIDPVKFYAHFGVKASVIKSDTAPTDGSRYIGKWVRGSYAHFVGMQDGKVVNNTLDFSHCVSEGKIADKDPFRIVEIIT